MAETIVKATAGLVQSEPAGDAVVVRTSSPVDR